MRFDNIFIRKKLTKKLELEEIKIDKLGSVVALVGKNGAGKTRVIRLIEEQFIPSIKISHFFDNTITNIPEYIKEILSKLQEPTKELIVLRQKVNDLQIISGEENDANIYYNKIQELNSKIKVLEDQNYHTEWRNFITFNKDFLQNINGVVKSYFIKIDLSKIIDIDKPSSEGKEQAFIAFEQLIEKKIQELSTKELRTLYTSGWVYFNNLPSILIADKYKAYKQNISFEEMPSYKRYLSLKKIVNSFLGGELNYVSEESSVKTSDGETTTIDRGYWNLSNVRLEYVNFSPGQKVLFSYCLLFFIYDQNPNIKIAESIIVIDEPELHLHADSEIEVINGIRKIIEEKGQLWIATHSLNILSNLNHDEIFLLENNSINSPRGTTMLKTLKDLAGRQLEKLGYLFNDLSNWSFLNFMTQNFNNPDVILSAKEGDPQVEVFKRTILDKSKTKCALLDFGAGKGRILSQIKKDEDLSKSIDDYCALEPDPNNVTELISKGTMEVFQDYAKLPENKFDYILLCNVLHEIEPVSEWIPILNKLKSSLKPEGFLLIIEDLQLPKGEKIGYHGFLIMDIDCLKLLFNYKTEVSQILPSEEKYQERIMCALLQKDLIGTINFESVKTSLEKLEENALSEIRKLRKPESQKLNKNLLGSKSAFYSQLHINAKLAIESLEESKIN